MDYGLQLGRRFRALKLWFVLRRYGVSGMQERLRAPHRARAGARRMDRGRARLGSGGAAPVLGRVFPLRARPRRWTATRWTRSIWRSWTRSTPAARCSFRPRGCTAGWCCASRSATSAPPARTSRWPGTCSGAKRRARRARTGPPRPAPGRNAESRSLAR